MTTNNIKKILIIRLSAIGDTIHTLPLLNTLRKQYPEAKIDWVVEDKASAFVIGNPLINNVYVIERKNRFQQYKKIINEIRKEQYDVVIDTQQLLKSAVIMGFSGAKRKIALDGGREFSYLFKNETVKTGKKFFDINFHVVYRNMEIAKYLGCKDLEINFVIPDFSDKISENIKEIINNLDKTRKTIVLSPATTWENKHWTIEGWSKIINELSGKYNIILTAGEKEKETINKITEKCPNADIINLTGKTSLEDLTYIYKNTDLTVSPDSGSSNIAWASNCRSIITLFFATSKNRTAPFGENYYSVSADINCAPCMSKHCKNKTKINSCKFTIEPEKIINIIKKVLQ